MQALAFEGLRKFTIEASRFRSSTTLLQPTMDLLRRNRDLEQIKLFLLDPTILTYLVPDPTSLNSTPFIWPNLGHLELRAAEIDFWQVAGDSDLLARFLTAHALLETLVIQCYHYSSENPPRSFSLAPYPHALPRLTLLHAPLYIIAGILESSSATSSLITIVDSIAHLPSNSDLEPLLERILFSLEQVLNPRLYRLHLQIPQFTHGLFMRLSKCAPNLQVLKLKEHFVDEDEVNEDIVLMLVSTALNRRS